MMSALSRHPDPAVEQQLRILRGQGWKVSHSLYRTFWDITCKAGTMNTRITGKLGRGWKGKTAQEQLRDFLIKHNAKHPRE